MKTLFKSGLILIICLLPFMLQSQTTVNIDQRTSHYYASFFDGSGYFDQGADEVGMWANMNSTSKRAVLWRKLKISGNNTGSDRSMQIGDKFTITVSAKRAYGRIGCALLASPSVGGSWDNRESNYAISVNLDGPAYTGGGYGLWYIKYKDESTSAANFGGNENTYYNYKFEFTLTASDRMNVTISDNNGNSSSFFDVFLNNSNPITDYSVYLQDDWTGNANANIYWKPVTSMQNTGSVTLGSSNATFSVTSAIADGLAANSTTVVSSNALTKSGSGTVTLEGTNTYTGTTTLSNGTLRLTGGIASSSVTINNGAILKSDGNNSTISALTINSGGQFTVEPSKALTVSGNFSNSGSSTIKSDATGTGSFIVNGTISGNITSERYIAGYTSASDGWHLISSPVNNFSIASTILAPGANDDLFWYDETQHLWMNYKEGSFTTFTNGYGYLCAYENTSTKSFSGTPNHSDLTFTNLSRTSNRGYHALGNPFQSALKWNDGNWALTDVNANAYLLNNGGTYSTISANGIIPSNQGFFVRVLSGTNSVTIPKAARVHDNTPWYKSGNTGLRLNLTASSTNDNTYVESGFLANSDATPGFDEVWDGFFLTGINGSPKMYIPMNGEKLSLNAIPEFSGSYEFAFIKGTSDHYRLTFQGFENLTDTEAFLTDLVTGDVLKINETQEYLFSSQSTDPEIRFLVSFDVVGLQEDILSDLSVFVKDYMLYFLNPLPSGSSLELYNLSGQLLQNINAIKGPVPVPFSPGIYIVRITTQGLTHAQKILIK